MLDKNNITPRLLTSSIKKYFKEQGLAVRCNYVKSARGVLGSYYQVRIPFDSQNTFPNDIRVRAVELTYGKELGELAVHNPEDINYGNTQCQSLSLYGQNWIILLNELNK